MDKSTLNCAIVDDSTLQRLSIVRLIDNHPSLNLVAEYNNAIEAKIGLATTDIDLVFLDIEMPILSGFDLCHLAFVAFPSNVLSKTKVTESS